METFWFENTFLELSVHVHTHICTFSGSSISNKIMPSAYFYGNYKRYTGIALKPMDRASSQLYHTIFPHNHHWQGILTRDKQENANGCLKNDIISITDLHYPLSSCVEIHILVSVNIHQVSMNVNRCNFSAWSNSVIWFCFMSLSCQMEFCQTTTHLLL